MNGTLVDWADANIHVGSHVVHYASAVFEGIRCYNTQSGPGVFRLDDHIKRLCQSAHIYRMPIAYDADELEEACLETIRANEMESCYIRPIVFRGYHSLGVELSFWVCEPVGVLGELRLSVHDQTRWLQNDDLTSVGWLEPDIDFIRRLQSEGLSNLRRPV